MRPGRDRGDCPVDPRIYAGHRDKSTRPPLHSGRDSRPPPGQACGQVVDGYEIFPQFSARIRYILVAPTSPTTEHDPARRCERFHGIQSRAVPTDRAGLDRVTGQGRRGLGRADWRGWRGVDRDVRGPLKVPGPEAPGRETGRPDDSLGARPRAVTLGDGSVDGMAEPALRRRGRRLGVLVVSAAGMSRSAAGEPKSGWRSTERCRGSRAPDRGQVGGDCVSTIRRQARNGTPDRADTRPGNRPRGRRIGKAGRMAALRWKRASRTGMRPRYRGPSDRAAGGPDRTVSGGPSARRDRDGGRGSGDASRMDREPTGRGVLSGQCPLNATAGAGIDGRGGDAWPAIRPAARKTGSSRVRADCAGIDVKSPARGRGRKDVGSLTNLGRRVQSEAGF